MRDQHPKAGQNVWLKHGTYLMHWPPPRLVNVGGTPFRVEDWGERLFAGIDPASNPAATLAYTMRRGQVGLPDDDAIVYGKDADGNGHLVHVSEIAEEGEF